MPGIGIHCKNMRNLLVIASYYYVWVTRVGRVLGLAQSEIVRQVPGDPIIDDTVRSSMEEITRALPIQPTLNGWYRKSWDCEKPPHRSAVGTKDDIQARKRPE